MVNTSSPAQKIFVSTGACLGWFAVIFQFYLIILNRTGTIAETIVRFFSFFTILTNILVAVCFSFLLLNPLSRRGQFFAKASTLTAVAVYITVVGIVYNLILRFLWAPKGLQRIVDELLHLVNPVFFIVFWLLFVSEKMLLWKQMLPWLLYPFAYCIYVLIRGKLTNDYPYPFMNVDQLGFPAVLINIGGMIVLFIVISLLFVGITKLRKRVQ